MFATPRPHLVSIVGANKRHGKIEGRTMKAYVSLAAVALFLAPSAFAAERCAGTASTPWDGAGTGWTIDAFADGATCETAVGTLVVRNATGEPVYWTAQPAAQTMLLAYKTSAAELVAGLKEWIDPKGGKAQTADELPEWKAGAEAPGEAGAEFPFFAAEGMPREEYEKIRATKAPVFCYVQGMESVNCIVLEKESGMLISVGVQTFPG